MRAGEERKADFIDIVVWRQTAEFVCKYFHKRQPHRRGRFHPDAHGEDKTGNKRYAFEVVGEQRPLFTGEKSGSTGGQGGSGAPAPRLVPAASRARRARQLCRQRRRFRRDRRQRRSTVLRRRTCPARPFRYFETRRKNTMPFDRDRQDSRGGRPRGRRKKVCSFCVTVSTTLTIKRHPPPARSAKIITFPRARENPPRRVNTCGFFVFHQRCELTVAIVDTRHVAQILLPYHLFYWSILFSASRLTKRLNIELQHLFSHPFSARAADFYDK